MTNITDTLIKEIENSIKWHNYKYRQMIIIQWSIMILVAIAGAFTAVSGSTQGQEQWFAQPNALVVWGATTAIGATINQIGNPGKIGDFHLNQKLALKAIRGAIQYRGLPVDVADDLRSTARKNPEEAVERLNQWRSDSGQVLVG